MPAFRISLSLAMLFALTNLARAASDPPPGAASCSGCHAARPSASQTVPVLYGRNAGEIIAEMAAFRDGTRASTVMNRIAKGFSDDETRAIATWLASQRPQ
jgi:sulfide dehydrogenase cytochrome subunit